MRAAGHRCLTTLYDEVQACVVQGCCMASFILLSSSPNMNISQLALGVQVAVLGAVNAHDAYLGCSSSHPQMTSRIPAG
jgi:hypothetical protein